MKIVFRADASIEIGTGHVMRCLTLAEALRDQGAECQFICGLQDGNMLQAIRDKGFKASSIDSFIDWQIDLEQTQAVLTKSNVDWIVVDHYALDIRWEQALKTYCRKLMVIDDLADRPHDCDLLLDQNLGRTKGDYERLVPQACQLLIGPEYALLRPEFATWRDYSLKRRAENPALKRLLISMGGTDYPDSTSQILQALKQAPLPTDCHITVVMGACSPWIQQVTDLAKTMPWTTDVKVNVSNMAELMASSDLAIGAAGSTSWERCCLGLPTLVVILAENQKSGAAHLAQSNACILLEQTMDINPTLLEAITVTSTAQTLQHMSEAASKLTYGQGARSVARRFYRSRIREMQQADLGMVLAWRNHLEIRTSMHSQHEISFNEHQNWFAKAKQDPGKHLLIFECNDEALGFVNFTETSTHGDADWGFYASPRAPKGSGRRLGQEALQYAFETLRLKKIHGEVLHSNIISQKFHKMLGFNLKTTGKNAISFILTKEEYAQ